MPSEGRSVRSYAVLAAGSLLSVGAMLVALVHSPLFRSGRIAVVGASHYSQPEVLRLAGLSDGTNVFFMDTAAIEVRLEKDPWIAEAAIGRSLPGTVRIQIVERSPVAAVEVAGGFETLATDGTVLATSSTQPGLPLIVAADDRHTAAGAGLVGVMQPALRSRVESLDIDLSGEVVVNLDSGLTVTYGGLNEGRAKAQALTSLLRWGQDQGIGFVSADVSVPGAPSAEIAGGGTVRPVT